MKCTQLVYIKSHDTRHVSLYSAERVVQCHIVNAIWNNSKMSDFENFNVELANIVLSIFEQTVHLSLWNIPISLM
jgi:hypothetical protein